MKTLLRYFLRYIIFWLFIFFVNRLLFLLSVIPFLKDASFAHSLGSLYSGWLLDLSTAGYMLALPGLFFIAGYLAGRKWILTAGRYVASIFIVLYCLASVGELCLYQEWTTKLNMQALQHFQHPAEVFQSATLKLTVLFFGLSLILSFAYIVLYSRYLPGRLLLPDELPPFRKRALQASLFFLIFIPVNFLLIRGGWSAIPISDSDAYYSKNHVLNDVAVNPLWGLGHNVFEYSSQDVENQYVFMSDAEAQFTRKALLAVEKDTTLHFLAKEKPNIVFLILEGVSAYMMKPPGEVSWMPFLDSLARDGITYSNCYAAAYASDQGIPAILSGYPSVPRIAITNQSVKSLKLPCISRDLKHLGYESGFVFGGQLNYGNIRSYLYNMEFDVIKERKDFPVSIPGGHLGIHDMDMAPLAGGVINSAKQPFVYAWFTVSSHSPYDIPEEIRPLVDHRQNPYVNCVQYTDKAMKLFFEKVKSQPWYSNTLFVVVSDHSHYTQYDFDIEHKGYHRIACFFYGDVIKKEFRGMTMEKTVSQLDLVPTLLKQFGLSTVAYRFGKNMMNPYTQHFAFYDYHHGTGFVTDSCFLSKAKELKEPVLNTCGDSFATSILRKKHDAFLQEAYLDYLSR